MKPFSEVPIKPDVSDAAKPPEANVDRPNETEGWKNSIELTDDTGEWVNSIELPDDSGEWQDNIELPSDMTTLEPKGDLLDITEQDIPTILNSEKGTTLSIRSPENHGKWSGERGNSTWKPDPEYVPPEKSKNPDKPYSNPDSLTWEKLLEKYDIDGVEFKDGYPVFDDISKGTVEIDGFETGGEVAKRHNFAKAYRALSEERGCTWQEVKDWMDKNNYTWHECEDKKTMQKVPHEIHANIPHDGGRCQE